MKVRADIAALIRAGHTDASVACRVGCHRSTVTRARLRLGMPQTEALRQTLAEDAPTGRVAEYRPERMPTSPAQQAANRERLLAALRDAAA